MRQAGTIPSKQDAERFADYLLTLEIGAKVEPSDGQWAIWIRDENQVGRSKEELDKFLAQPDDARYEVGDQARLARREAAQRAKTAQKNYVDMRNEWASPWRRRPITMLLIVASVLATFALGDDSKLMFSMQDILNGEVWRLITPIFLHSRDNLLLHLVFNMWWMYDLGMLVERQMGSLRYAAMVLVIALVSNIAQAYFVGPNFLGMSGVVYGLFGYAWVRGRLDPACGLYLRPDVVFIMVAWFLICMLGFFRVANVAHGAGLGAGVVLGFLVHVINQRRPNT